ncbi:uncharacterized protein [Palaemon carinicauda]|uniref:uncharacterized protein n=1 Tax=Palaemon carinicauda TaxID=392227 RepID=UPI0035B5FDAC
MEEMGLSQKVSSPWSSPLHIVLEKDDCLRLCGDYSRLNRQTEPDHSPFPNIADVTSYLHRAKKVAAVKDFPPPLTVKALQEFLGMIYYYHRFLPAIATTVAPLYASLKAKPKDLKWGVLKEASFCSVKKVISIAADPTFPIPHALPISPPIPAKSLLVQYSSRCSAALPALWPSSAENCPTAEAECDFLPILTLIDLAGDQISFDDSLNPVSVVTRSQSKEVDLAEVELDADSNNGQVTDIVTDVNNDNEVHIDNYDHNLSFQGHDNESFQGINWNTKVFKEAQGNEFNHLELCEGSDLSKPVFMKQKCLLYRVSRSVNAPADQVEVIRQLVVPERYRSEPFKEVVIDVVGLLSRTRRGNEYLLTMVDRVTRFPEAIPLRSNLGQKVVEALNGFFTKFGIPKVLQLDCGTNFTSKFFRKKMVELGVNHVTSSYHPESGSGGEVPPDFEDAPGRKNVLYHDVDVGDAKPIKQCPYRLNPVKKKIVQEEVRYMLDHDLIKPSCSPWSSPVVLVKKEGGQHRLCFDYRKEYDLQIKHVAGKDNVIPDVLSRTF